MDAVARNLASIHIYLFMIPATTDNTLGFLASLAYITTLLPSNLRAISPTLRFNTAIKTVIKTLIQSRRSLGIWTWLLSTAHACVALRQGKPATSIREFFAHSISGLLIITIFGLLTLTSNNWSMKQLKHHWKQLHSLTYVAAFLLLWHIVAKMNGQWTSTTGIVLALLIPTLSIICLRKYRQFVI
jgi:methionine sulfoxide reductase heme-binding subunit